MKDNKLITEFMEEIERSFVAALNEDYNEIIENESHHCHRVIIDDKGTYRWESDPSVNSLIDELDLNYLWKLFYKMGMNKNSEEIRKMYRDMGYSLSGYWEIFYWEENNPDAKSYEGA